MQSDALLVSVARYPYSGNRLSPLPGTMRDRLRVSRWVSDQAPGVALSDFVWNGQTPAQPNPWNGSAVESVLRSLLQQSLNAPRQRLFVYATAHGRYVSTSPPIPAVYCASHQTEVPDLLPTGDWLRSLIAARCYDEYVCFFDCCNDFQVGPMPVMPALNLPPRRDTPKVLVMAACKPGEQALGHGQNGGVFTEVLLEALSGSAGSSASNAVTAANVVDYVKENVPARADALKPGHVQTPVVWLDPEAHARLDSFELFQRAPVQGVDVAALLAAHDPAAVEVCAHDLTPLGRLQAQADGTVPLPALLPGKYLLRSTLDDWRQTLRVKTRFDDDGRRVAFAEAQPVA